MTSSSLHCKHVISIRDPVMLKATSSALRACSLVTTANRGRAHLRSAALGTAERLFAAASPSKLSSQPAHRLQAVRRLLATATMAVAVHPAPSSDALKVDRVNCLSDNYVWLLREPSGKVAVVDPSEAKPVAAALEQLSINPDYILNTHHHWDHTGGNEELKKKYGLTIVGPKADKDRIPGIDVALGEGDTWDFGQLKMHVFDTPGHTRGHITLYFPEAEAVFPGDTLFLMGCGRLFEGSPTQMWSSLSKIAALPSQTWVFCAHEYTQANAKWAQVVNPHNQELAERAKTIADQRSKGECTVPAKLAKELATNPFLRPQDPDIRKTLGLSGDASDLEVFTAVRKHKDNF